MYQCVDCLHVHGFETMHFITACILDALYEKKQAIMTNEERIAKLQAQVGNLQANSAQKDTLNAKYEAMVNESKGKIIQ